MIDKFSKDSELRWKKEKKTPDSLIVKYNVNMF